MRQASDARQRLSTQELSSLLTDRFALAPHHVAMHRPLITLEAPWIGQPHRTGPKDSPPCPLRTLAHRPLSNGAVLVCRSPPSRIEHVLVSFVRIGRVCTAPRDTRRLRADRNRPRDPVGPPQPHAPRHARARPSGSIRPLRGCLGKISFSIIRTTPAWGAGYHGRIETVETALIAIAFMLWGTAFMGSHQPADAETSAAQPSSRSAAAWHLALVLFTLGALMLADRVLTLRQLADSERRSGTSRERYSERMRHILAGKGFNTPSIDIVMEPLKGGSGRRHRQAAAPLPLFGYCLTVPRLLRTRRVRHHRTEQLSAAGDRGEGQRDDDRLMPMRHHAQEKLSATRHPSPPQENAGRRASHPAPGGTPLQL